MTATAEQRSRTMKAVKSCNTTPELKVRRVLHQMGYRYRLHRKDLPGKPDIVFGRSRKVIFVHGCFWHGHNCKRGNRMPATNVEYWQKKISGNVQRFLKQLEQLQEAGWKPLVLWECELRDLSGLDQRLREFLG